MQHNILNRLFNDMQIKCRIARLGPSTPWTTLCNCNALKNAPSGEQTKVRQMCCTLLQTGHEGEDQGIDEICRPAYALPASCLDRCTLPDRKITYARSSKIAKQTWSAPISLLRFVEIGSKLST